MYDTEGPSILYDNEGPSILYDNEGTSKLYDNEGPSILYGARWSNINSRSGGGHSGACSTFQPNDRYISNVFYFKMKMGPVFMAKIYDFNLYLLNITDLDLCILIY